MSTDPSGLWEQLDGLANAEPLSAEDDLILRMSAVSKVRSSKRAKDRKNKAKAGVSPTKGAIRKKEKRKVEKKKIQGRSQHTMLFCASVWHGGLRRAAPQPAIPTARCRYRHRYR
jgi:hypothetical protein